eukprot:2707896-Prymnesium_polylepis.1
MRVARGGGDGVRAETAGEGDGERGGRGGGGGERRTSGETGIGLCVNSEKVAHFLLYHSGRGATVYDAALQVAHFLFGVHVVGWTEPRRYSRYNVSRYSSNTAGVYQYSRYSNRG